MNRSLITIILLIFSQIILADDECNESVSTIKPTGFGALGGIYIDNINKLNIQFGFEYFKRDESNGLNSDQLYTQLGISEDTTSIELGFGESTDLGSTRYGINYIETDEKPLIGITLSSSGFGIILRVGYYHNYTTNDPELLLGFGIGI